MRYSTHLKRTGRQQKQLWRNWSVKHVIGSWLIGRCRAHVQSAVLIRQMGTSVTRVAMFRMLSNWSTPSASCATVRPKSKTPTTFSSNCLWSKTSWRSMSPKLSKTLSGVTIVSNWPRHCSKSGWKNAASRVTSSGAHQSQSQGSRTKCSKCGLTRQSARSRSQRTRLTSGATGGRTKRWSSNSSWVKTTSSSIRCSSRAHSLARTRTGN